MGHRVRGVIARSAGAPVEVVTVLVPDPGPGEALVRVQACGVCHTDLHHRDGAVGDRFPYLLGHEAAGVVEAVGADVTGLAAGDHVVLAWRAPCGRCRSCARGRPWYCFDSRTATRTPTLEDGTPLSAVLGIGAFAGRVLVAAGQAVKIDPAVRPEVAGLIGCAVMTGFGAVVNTAGVRHGDTVAVFGCGGVGDAAIHAAALAGARKIIAVDLERRKLAWAAEFGATDLVDASQVDPVTAIRELTGGFGADVTIEAVGHPDVMKQAFHARDRAGVLVQVGLPDRQMRIDLRMLDIFGRGGALKPSWYGDCLPSRDVPLLADLYLRGRYDLDRFVSETIALDQVEDAFARMRRGEVIRSVVVPDAG
jgi:S-(hydroxymethyl)mycothiol dehydrogenase